MAHADLTVRRLGGRVSTFTVTHYFATAGLVASPLLMLAFGQRITLHTQRSPLLFLEVFVMGLCGFAGQVCLNKGMQMERAGPASAMRFVDIVFVFIWEMAFLGVKASAWSVAGAVLISICIIIIGVKKVVIERRRRAAAVAAAAASAGPSEEREQAGSPRA